MRSRLVLGDEMLLMAVMMAVLTRLQTTASKPDFAGRDQVEGRRLVKVVSARNRYRYLFGHHAL
jgi:hypothetical protein